MYVDSAGQDLTRPKPTSWPAPAACMSWRWWYHNNTHWLCQAWQTKNRLSTNQASCCNVAFLANTADRQTDITNTKLILTCCSCCCCLNTHGTLYLHIHLNAINNKSLKNQLVLLEPLSSFLTLTSIHTYAGTCMIPRGAWMLSLFYVLSAWKSSIPATTTPWSNRGMENSKLFGISGVW